MCKVLENHFVLTFNPGPIYENLQDKSLDNLHNKPCYEEREEKSLIQRNYRVGNDLVAVFNFLMILFFQAS